MNKGQRWTDGENAAWGWRTGSREEASGGRRWRERKRQACACHTMGRRRRGGVGRGEGDSGEKKVGQGRGGRGASDEARWTEREIAEGWRRERGVVVAGWGGKAALVMDVRRPSKPNKSNKTELFLEGRG